VRECKNEFINALRCRAVGEDLRNVGLEKEHGHSLTGFVDVLELLEAVGQACKDALDTIILVEGLQDGVSGLFGWALKSIKKCLCKQVHDPWHLMRGKLNGDKLNTAIHTVYIKVQ